MLTGRNIRDLGTIKGLASGTITCSQVVLLLYGGLGLGHAMALTKKAHRLELFLLIS
jgi:hypothetical protein